MNDRTLVAPAAPPLRAGNLPAWHAWRATAAAAACGVAAYGLFPHDLAFLTHVMSLIVLAVSLDLVVGYCGIATVGHAVLFGAGAYAAGLSCKAGGTDPLLMLAVGAAAGGVAGLASGLLVTRFSHLPQLVLSIALVQLVQALASKASGITGGGDGLSNIEPGRLLGMFEFDLAGRTAYGFALAVALAVLVLAGALVRSPFGLLCRAIRNDPVRVAAMGAAVYPALVKMYLLSGAVAGIGGALSAVTTRVVGLDSLGFERSAQALVMLVFGGSGTLWGAVLGTVVYQALEHAIAVAYPFHWLTLVGVLLIALVLFLPGGLQSLVRRARARRMPREAE